MLAWQAAQAPPARIMVSPLERHAALDAELARRGWAVAVTTDVLVGPLDEVAAAAAAVPRAGLTASVRSRTAPEPAWLAAWAACEQRPLAVAQREGDLILTALAGRALYALVRDGDTGAALGVGLGVSVGSWCGLFGMAAHPDARRRGVGSAVLGALAEAARARGARRAYLQVLTTNAPAQALYARHGFRRSHGYRTREAPSGSPVEASPSSPASVPVSLPSVV